MLLDSDIKHVDQASAVKNRLITVKHTSSLKQVLSTCSGMVSTMSSVSFVPLSAAATWSFETNQDRMSSSCLDGNKAVKATHPTFSFFQNKPTTVFSVPVGRPFLFIRAGRLVPARRATANVRHATVHLSKCHQTEVVHKPCAWQTCGGKTYACQQ